MKALFQEYVPASAIKKSKREIVRGALVTLAMMQRHAVSSRIAGRPDPTTEQFAQFLARDLGTAEGVNKGAA